MKDENKKKWDVSSQKRLDTSEWAEWSLNPHTDEEIIERFDHDPWSVCFAYVCKVSPLKEETIEYLSEKTMNHESGFDRLDWKEISLNSPLSEQFVLKHANEIYWRELYNNKNAKLSRKFWNENKYRVTEQVNINERRKKVQNDKKTTNSPNNPYKYTNMDDKPSVPKPKVKPKAIIPK